jgi:ankyrin repeat protein
MRAEARSLVRPRWRMFGALSMAMVLSASAIAESPVADAAMQGDLTKLRALIEGGADVNASQGDGMTALHWAAENGDVEMVQTLLFAGAFPNSATRNGAYTPLHLGAKAGRAGSVEALLVGGADPDATTVTGVTALHFAAAAAAVESVTSLLAHGGQVDVKESVSGQTPLIFAAAADRAGSIDVLLDAGADAAATTTIIDVSARSAEDRDLRELRDQRKELEWNRGFVEVGYGQSPQAGEEEDDEETAEGEEPAEALADEDEAEAEVEETPVEVVVTRLSFPQLIDKKGGMTALLHAAREGHASAIEALVRRGVKVDQQSADGTSPLLIATINGHFDLAMRLLALGADPNVASDAGATALYGAINLQWGPTSWYPQPNAFKQQTASYLDLMEALLQAGGDPNARLERELWYTEFNTPRLSTSHWGTTAFWRAAYGTDVAAMELLLQYGADPDIPSRKKPGRRFNPPNGEDEEGGYPFPPVPVGGPAESPIHVASGAGYGLGFAGNAHRHKPDGWMPTIRYLVEELGADVNLRDPQGYTPLHNAASRGDNEMIRYLVAHGADVMVESRDGQTVADMANGPFQRISPFPETLELLDGMGVVNNHRCVSC